MNCKKPFVKGTAAYSCGQCLPCRINRKRIWTHRIMLESALHKDNAFVTLTYSPEELPPLGTLVPEHLKLFLYSLRQALKPHRIRYFAVGEYGDESERPHYHLALFNYPACRNGYTNGRGASRCCDACSLIQRLWQRGHVYIGSLEQNSASYVAGYVTKKLTDPNDARLDGRHPEFTRMSTKPGLGAGMMDEVASTLLELGLEKTLPDVPAALGHGKKKWPLGRYLRRRLRTRIGRDEKAPETTIKEMEEALRPLYEASQLMAPRGHRQTQFKNLIIDAAEGKVIQLEARHKRYRKRGTI